MTQRFLLTIDGIDLPGVNSGSTYSTVDGIDAITVRFPPTGLPQVSNLKLRVRADAVPSW